MQTLFVYATRKVLSKIVSFCLIKDRVLMGNIERDLIAKIYIKIFNTKNYASLKLSNWSQITNNKQQRKSIRKAAFEIIIFGIYDSMHGNLNDKGLKLQELLDSIYDLHFFE